MQLTSFWLALQFLTRVPTPAVATVEGQDWGHAVLYFPLVGLLIGALLYVMALPLAPVDAPLQAGLLLLVWVGFTGALHLDGLADSADAWIGGQGDPERTLAIMKDPYAGPAGVAAVVLVLLLKFAALSALLRESAYSGLWLAPVLGRAALLWFLLATPYVRPQGLGVAMRDHLPRSAAQWVLLGIALWVLLLLGWSALLLFVLCGLLAVYLRWTMLRRIGGATGDTLGAVVELMEVAVLVGLALLLAN